MSRLRGTDVTIQVEPLRQWPAGYERRSPYERRRHPYRTTDGTPLLDKTISDLDDELRMIDAEGVVLQVDVDGDQIRKSDGLPYSRADVDPGVVLTFENENGVQTFPADLYDDWVGNLRAIYFTLHDLRRISRNGVGRGSEQYRGFAQLPGAGQTTVTMTARDAAIEIARATLYDADDVLEDPATFRQAYRRKVKMAHPDRGGDPQAWLRVQDAAKVLEAHHGD